MLTGKQYTILFDAYVISAQKASSQLSDRGYAAMPLELDWGIDNGIMTIQAEDMQKESLSIFGYDYTSEKLKGIRDLFKNAKTLYAYRLNGGVKSANNYATAKYSGIRGNDIKIVVSLNVDIENSFDVTTILDSKEVDKQTVKNAAELKANDYVAFKSNATLTATAATALTGGTNGTVTGAEYQKALDKFESYSFNTLGCLSTEKTICDLFTAFTKRMRDETGVKFQTVLYRTYSDYEGIISVENSIKDAGWAESAAVYWVTGASAGCEVNKSNLNKVYNGEFEIDVDYKQSQLEAGLKAGKFMFHKVGDTVRVLNDINTFISFTVYKSAEFTSNQTVRVLDQIGNDMAVLFNYKYLGAVPNDKGGRVSLWSDITSLIGKLQQLEAVEDFEPSNVTVEQGNSKKAVVVTVSVTPVNAMAQLYMTVMVA